MLLALRIISLAAAAGSFLGVILIGNSIARDVNGTLGTDYDSIWSLNGNRVWQEHQRLFPYSRKRAALGTMLLGWLALLFVTGFLGR